jgi:hypothetical protein
MIDRASINGASSHREVRLEIPQMATPTPVTRRAVHALPEGDALPTEFLLFAPGDNPSTQGPAIWDATAAAAVLARAKERGSVEYPIDLEHRSLDKGAVALTKDATDAMGWFRLAVRDGALWAVNVRFTPEGAERLRAKKQRYTSPAFYWLDEPNGRVGEVINVALVAMPATNNQQALVAASRGTARKVPVNDATKKAAAKLLADIADGKLAAKNSRVLAARVSLGTARALERHARTLGMTPGAVLRGMVERAAKPKDRKRLTDLLGLPADATDAEITTAVTDLIAATSDTAGAPPAAAGATGGAADAPPPASAFRRELTKAERAYCAKHKLTPEQFAARKRAAVRRK